MDYQVTTVPMVLLVGAGPAMVEEVVEAMADPTEGIRIRATDMAGMEMTVTTSMPRNDEVQPPCQLDFSLL